MMDLMFFLITFVAISAIGPIFTALIFKKVTSHKSTDAKAARIALLIRIRNGAMTLLRKEYSVLAVVIAFFIAGACWYLWFMNININLFGSIFLGAAIGAATSIVIGLIKNNL